jgi:hypothetical protein
MSKFTKTERKEIKSLVANAMIRHLNIHEAQKYIQDSLHVTISSDYVYHIKMQLKKDCGKELDLLQKDRDFYLKEVFTDRVRELEAQQRVLWDIIENNKDEPEIQIKAVHELHAISVNLNKAYQSLPNLVTLQIPTLEQEQERAQSQSQEPVF